MAHYFYKGDGLEVGAFVIHICLIMIAMLNTQIYLKILN